jgi:hypothetical protein
VLKIALEAGAMKVGRVALDGTKVKASASKHKAMSYGRMKEKEKAIREEVKKLLAEAEAADADEDRRCGRERRGDELPEELQRRETRLKKIAEARRALEQRARVKAEQQGEDSKQAQPKNKDQYNFTDPESRIMKGGDGFVQGYNAQAAVEPALQLVVGQAVTQAAKDKEQLLPMMDVVERQSGQRPDLVLADSGYCQEENLKGMESEDPPGGASRATSPSAGRSTVKARSPVRRDRCRRCDPRGCNFPERQIGLCHRSDLFTEAGRSLVRVDDSAPLRPSGHSLNLEVFPMDPRKCQAFTAFPDKAEETPTSYQVTSSCSRALSLVCFCRKGGSKKAQTSKTNSFWIGSIQRKKSACGSRASSASTSRR